MEINTHGQWVKYSEYQELEVGKSYKITFNGDCLVALSKDKPAVGMKVPYLEFTVEDGINLWIKTAK